MGVETQMVTPRRLDVELPAMDQVGYVVRNMEKALERYGPLFGPFEVIDYELEGPIYRGVPRDCRLRIAYGRSGSIEIELIQVLEGDSVHREFIDAGREGVHHIRFMVDDLDRVLRAIAGNGFRPIWLHRIPIAAWAYVEHESRDGVLLEFLQMNAG